MVLYLERVNRETGIDAGAAYASGRVVGWHLFWLTAAAVLVGAALLLGQCATAHAQDAEAAPAECGDTTGHTAPRRASVTHEGEAGVWFRLDVARCLLGDVTELRLVRERVGLLDARLEIREEQITLTREALDLGRRAEERATGALEAAVRGRREAEEERDAWWRSPILWFAVGAVVTVALEVVAVYALAALTP